MYTSRSCTLSCVRTLQRNGGERRWRRRNKRRRRRWWWRWRWTGAVPFQEPAAPAGQRFGRRRQLQRRRVPGQRWWRRRPAPAPSPARWWRRRPFARPLQQVPADRAVRARRRTAAGHAQTALLPGGWLGMGGGRRGRGHAPAHPRAAPLVRRVRPGTGAQVRAQRRGTRRYCTPPRSSIIE